MIENTIAGSTSFSLGPTSSGHAATQVPSLSKVLAKAVPPGKPHSRAITQDAVYEGMDTKVLEEVVFGAAVYDATESQGCPC